MYNYEIVCNFSSMRKGRGSSITGGNHKLQVDIFSEEEIDETNLVNQELIDVCKQAIYANSKFKGVVCELRIVSIKKFESL